MAKRLSRRRNWLPARLVALVALTSLARPAGAAVIDEFSIQSLGTRPAGIVAGPDGSLWFTEFAGSRIGRITTAGAITAFSLPSGRGRLGHRPSGTIIGGRD